MQIFLESVILFVKEIEKLKSFYTANFHFSVEEEIAGSWVVLNCGEFKLALHQIPAEYIDKDNENWNTDNNVKLVFETADNIASVQQQLLEAGVNVGEVRTWDGYPFRLVEGKDSEGNVFQLKQKKL